MTQVAFSGLPVIAIQVGFVIVAALPVWLGAQVTGATRPTFWRSVLALFLGVVASFIGLLIGGPAVLIIAPLAFLFSFKFVLDMSFGGAFVLCIITVVGYFLMGKFIGGGVEFNKDEKETTASASSTQSQVIWASACDLGAYRASFT